MIVWRYIYTFSRYILGRKTHTKSEITSSIQSNFGIIKNSFYMIQHWSMWRKDKSFRSFMTIQYWLIVAYTCINLKQLILYDCVIQPSKSTTLCLHFHKDQIAYSYSGGHYDELSNAKPNCFWWVVKFKYASKQLVVVVCVTTTSTNNDQYFFFEYSIVMVIN